MVLLLLLLSPSPHIRLFTNHFTGIVVFNPYQLCGVTIVSPVLKEK